MMTPKKRLAAALMTALIAPLALAAEEKTKAVNDATIMVTVNKVGISQATFADGMRDQLQRGAKDSQQLRAAVMDELIIAEALAQQAAKSKVANNSDVKRALANAQRAILAEAYMVQQLNESPISDAQVRSEYDRQIAMTKEGRNSVEYRIAQIVTKDESSAKAVLARINVGEDFTAVAKASSIDPEVALSGAELPWSLPDQLIQPLGDKVVSLAKGEVTSEPVKSSVGFHVLKVLDSRPFKAPSFEESKQNIRMALLERRKQEIIRQVIDKTEVKPN
jgi:peptidyl-prolyl cis-trans isomerase C